MVLLCDFLTRTEDYRLLDIFMLTCRSHFDVKFLDSSPTLLCLFSTFLTCEALFERVDESRRMSADAFCIVDGGLALRIIVVKQTVWKRDSTLGAC